MADEYKTDSSISLNNLRSIFVDMLKYLPSKFVGIMGNVIIVPIYTNLLTPEQYGLYSISIATLSFLCIIFFDWIGSSGLRFFKIHQLKGNLRQYFSSLVSLLVINYLLMLCTVLLFRHSLTGFFKIPMYYLYFLILLIIPVSFRSLLFQIIRAQIKPSVYTAFTILNQFLTIGIAICIIKYLHWKAFSILVAMAISIFLIDICLVWIVKLFSGFKFEKVQFKIIGKFVWYGFPLAIASLSMWIMNQSNKFIIQYYKDSFYNGIIGVSYNMTYSIFLTMFSIVMIAALPRIFMMYEQKQNPRNIISRLSGYFIALTTPFIVFISIYTPEYVKFMANPKFAQAVELVPFLLVSTFFTGLTDYTTIQYHLTKKTYINTIIRLIPGIIGVFLNIKFIPQYGLLCVGWTTLFTCVLYFLLTLIFVQKGLSWKFPVREIVCSVLSLFPSLCLIYGYKHYFADLNGITQMLSAILLYYITFLGINKLYSVKYN